jgi:cytochrome b561
MPGSGPDHSKLYDSPSVYGWISILLHWLTTAIVIALWFIGKSIGTVPAELLDSRRALHVSIAMTAWLILAFRIAWRVRSRHPRVRGQSLRIHRIARGTHYTMLVLLALMLLSGPLLAWSGGRPINVFGIVSLPSPLGASETGSTIAGAVHANAALLLLLLTIVHIGGALKHLMFHSDDTIVRMIWPGKADDS